MSSPESRDEPGRNQRQTGEKDPTPLLLGLIGIAFLVHELQWVLLPFVISGLVAFLLTAPVEWIGARLRRPRWVAVVMVFLAVLLLMALVFWFGVQPLARELAKAVTGVKPLLEGFAKAILKDRTVDLFGAQMSAGQLAQAGAATVRNWVGSPNHIAWIGSSAAAAAFGLFLGFVLLFYFLLSGPKLMRGALWLAPETQRPMIAEILRRLDPLLKRYFVGVIVTVVYATVAAYLGLGLWLQLRHAAILAVLTGMLETIPVVGPAASAALAGLAAIRSAKSIGLIISYAIYAVALRLSIDQFLGPIALGAAARLNPAVIIFCFLAGGVLFGLVGIILAVPAALAVRVTLSVVRSTPQSQGFRDK